MTRPGVDRLLVLALAVCATYQAQVLVEGDGPGSDTIFWAPGAVNGLSLGDWPILVLWAVVTTSCVAVALRTRTTVAAPLLDRGLVALVGLVLTFWTLTLVKGDGPDSGRTIVAFSDVDGINTGDVPILLTWVVGVGACAALWWRVRRHDG